MEDKTDKTDQDTFEKLSKAEGIPKFSQICRVCLCETNENDQQLNTRILLLNISQEIRSLLEESTRVQIVDLDFLPNDICDRCFKTLTAWYRFRSQTQRSNEILKKYLKELSTSIDSKSLPNSDLTIHLQGNELKVIPKQNVSEIQGFQVSVVKDKPEVVGFVFHCDSCSMTFTHQLGLDKHQEEHITPDRQKTFKCQHCPKSFAFRNGLHNHMKITQHHLSRYKFQCDVCERGFNGKSSLTKHKKKKRCIPLNLIEQCKLQKLDFPKDELTEIMDKIIRETKISCILCKKTFKCHPEFVNHFAKHRKDRKCTICTKVFARFSNLEKHMRVHLRVSMYNCPMCSRPFFSCRDFRAHIYEHGKREWVYRCNVCQKEFFVVREFENHMVKHLENDKKSLEEGKHNDGIKIENVDEIEINNECESDASADDYSQIGSTNEMEEDIQDSQDVPFHLVKKEEEESENDSDIKKQMDIIDSKPKTSLIKTETHLNSASQLETKIPTCPESSDKACQLKNVDNNQSNTDLTEVKTENSDLDNSSSEEENADETDDDNISTSSKPNDQVSKQNSDHIQKILEECKVNCHVAGCQTKCSGLPEIWKHFHKKHLSGRKPFICCECFEEFDTKVLIRVHIKKYYTFKCPVCFKLQTTGSTLKRHVILTHSVDRPYKCTECTQTFNRPASLKVHQNTHSKNKEFVCGICSKDFFSYNGLYLHSKSHKDIKELQCSICSRQFSSKDRLKRHVGIDNCSKRHKK